MSEQADLMVSIADTTRDYRAGELPKLTSEHIGRWVGQFDKAAQLPLLREMDQVLKSTYFSQNKVLRFLKIILDAKKLVGDNPVSFWKKVNFLNIQRAGYSQISLLALFEKLLFNRHRLKLADCGGEAAEFVYLDDVVFSGNRIRRDLEAWLQNAAPAKSLVHIVCIAIHKGGQYYVDNRITEATENTTKEVKLKWWGGVILEDRKAHINVSNVLRPTQIPDDELVAKYVEQMRYKLKLRTPKRSGSDKPFSGEEGRSILEQELLRAGVRVRAMCPNLSEKHRPLGYSLLDTLGFGSTIVTYRNCPNSSPLALWVGDPWIPLFPRTTNAETDARRMLENLQGSSS